MAVKIMVAAKLYYPIREMAHLVRSLTGFPVTSLLNFPVMQPNAPGGLCISKATDTYCSGSQLGLQSWSGSATDTLSAHKPNVSSAFHSDKVPDLCWKVIKFAPRLAKGTFRDFPLSLKFNARKDW